MLIVNNQFNPMVTVKSKNKIIRNGVCVNESSQVILTISLKPVTMHEMAKHFKEECKCKDALYLDGAISQIYWPQKGYFGKTSLIGPIIGVTQKNNEYNK